VGIRTLFFDTYAFFEIINGNNKYTPYATNVAIVTTRLNLMELFYGLLIKYGEEVANKYYDRYLLYTVNINDITIKNSMLLRVSLKNKGLSYTDCIGYTIAKEMNIKFLTGDMQFENLPNVEFVK